jgi:hypothetical protein
MKPLSAAAGVSPAVTSSCPAVSTPTPGRATSAGATAATRAWSWRSSWSSSAWSCCQRRARVRRLALVAAVGLVKGPGRMAAHALTRALVLSPSSGWRSSSGALYSNPVQLLGGCHPSLHGTAAGHPQHPDHLHLALTGLGRGGGHPGLGRPGSGLGVDRIRLAPATTGAAVGAVDLHHLEAVGAHEPGQAGPVGAGASPMRSTGPKRSAQVTSAT